MERPEDFPHWFVALCAVIFTLEGITGFMFNLIVLIVYHLNRRTLKNASNILIINLNIVDMVISVVCCPMSVVYILTSRFHGTAVCYLHEASVAFASTASAINLLCISFDRYESIVLPLKRKITDTNVNKIIALIWVSAAVAVILPFSSYLELNIKDILSDYDSVNNSVPCSYWLHKSKAFYIHELYFVAAFLISSLVTLVCYYKVFRLAKQRLAARIALLRSALATTSGSQPLMEVKKQQDKRVTTMTLAIVCAFMICWGPNMLIGVCALFWGSKLSYEMLQIGLMCLAYLTTILHPLLYAFMRDNFRGALLDKWRGRPTIHQTKISPTDDKTSTAVKIVVARHDADLDDLPTISRIIQPTNTVTVTIQDSLVYDVS